MEQLIMKQPQIERRDEFQPDTEEGFFDTQAVETAHPVVPLAEIPDAVVPKKRFRVPLSRTPQSRFSLLTLALILLPALAIFAGVGTYLYNSQIENDFDETPEIKKTVIAAEEINIKPPSEKPAPVVPKNSFNDSQQKTSEREETVENLPDAAEESTNDKDSIPLAVILDELKRNVNIEKPDKKQMEDEEDAPEIKRKRNENKKQEKLERKNKHENRQNPDFEKNSGNENDNN
jgi:hypothetical protein